MDVSHHATQPLSKSGSTWLFCSKYQPRNQKNSPGPRPDFKIPIDTIPPLVEIVVTQWMEAMSLLHFFSCVREYVWITIKQEQKNRSWLILMPQIFPSFQSRALSRMEFFYFKDGRFLNIYRSIIYVIILQNEIVWNSFFF